MPQDEPFLVRLYASTRSEEMKLVPWDEAQKAAFLRMQFDLQTRHYREHYSDAAFLILELDGTPIGRMYVHRSAEQILLIDIALLPEHRGSGIGSEVLRDLLAESAESSKPVRIHVEHQNPALRLYQRLGFRIREDKGLHYEIEWSPDTSATT
jgi:ribosomal protein S18 acetylase RimI-like enzyme